MSITKSSTASGAPFDSAPRAAVNPSLRPLCAAGPNDWDLDVGTPDSWRSAVQTCRVCPLLEHCGQLARSFIARGDAPRAMIWAGVAYDNAGKVVENLDRHRIAPIDHKRPLRIVRHGCAATREEPVPATREELAPAPRRHLVLGRPLRATGTE
ncbi:hypothetical protein ACFROC_00395 [Nocardia tengchongensis]|uniref:hypothetical protein n=1 Tax=Nocardia tengchongensis TaxID=2055889 RepID=UPI003699617B